MKEKLKWYDKYRMEKGSWRLSGIWYQKFHDPNDLEKQNQN